MKYEFDHYKEATARQTELKEEMPAVPSAYQPSGRFSVAAPLFLLVGAALAALAAAGIALACDGGAILCWRGAGWLSDGAARWPLGLTIAAWVGIVLLWVVALIVYAASYLLLGAGFAGAFGVANKQGKNRSVFLAMLFALLGLAGCVYGYWLILNRIGWTTWFRHHSDWYDDWHPWSRYILGGLAVVLAAVLVMEAVQGAKFCESCQLYMDEMQLPKLDEDGASGVIGLLRERQYPEAATLCTDSPGDVCTPHLYICPFCGGGFIDYKLQYQASYKKGGDDDGSGEIDETWIIASRQLEAEEVNDFRAAAMQRFGGTFAGRLKLFARRPQNPDRSEQ